MTKPNLKRRISKRKTHSITQKQLVDVSSHSNDSDYKIQFLLMCQIMC